VNGIVADYTPYHGKTAYEYGDHGAKDIDTDDTAPVGLSVDSCEARCDDDAACDCVAFRLSDGKCWKRADCVPGKFGTDNAYDTYVKVSAPTPAPPGAWYAGIDSIHVLHPGDAFDYWEFYKQQRFAQFSDKRYALILTSGQYNDAEIGVGYYTSVIGAGRSQDDVKVKSFYALNEEDGHSTNNFWRSVEGLTSMNPDIIYSVSQASGVRRATILGDVHLSEPHGYSSGGYFSNVHIGGHVDPGTQQQYTFRNCKLDGGIDTPQYNLVFVGTEGGWDESPRVAGVEATPRIAEKPYLLEEQGQWSIVVPAYKDDAVGLYDASSDVLETIPMSDVFVAREGDSAAVINQGLLGKRALLLTPGIYGLEEALEISVEGFVVLGIGFPTLVPHQGNSALVVSADLVRVGGLLLEAGTAKGDAATEPLLLWTGHSGVLSDIFTRTGAFAYERDFKASCAVTRADVHVQLDGSDMIVDNTWFWHADHDDCNYQSNDCYDEHGLVVNGDNVTIYGLFVEHQYKNLVQWNGEDGRVFFYQAELPYQQGDFGHNGFVGYSVDLDVQRHSAVGLGVYVVFQNLWGVTAYRAPATTNFKNRVICGFGGATTQQFDHFGCFSEGGEQCYDGREQCSAAQCWLSASGSSIELV
jgi:hypothetical protein